jgi:hypothetical protein
MKGKKYSCNRGLLYKSEGLRQVCHAVHFPEQAVKIYRFGGAKAVVDFDLPTFTPHSSLCSSWLRQVLHSTRRVLGLENGQYKSQPIHYAEKARSL